MIVWFKNLRAYRFTRAMELPAEALEQQMADFAFTPCASQDMAKFGWASAIGGDAFLHAANGHYLLRAKHEKKNIPGYVVKEAVNAKVAQLEAEQQRKLKKVERDTIKDEVMQTLLPRAFSKISVTQIWIDLKAQLVFVDSASAQGAEDALALLRKTIGSLPVVPLSVQKPIELTLTEWVRSGDAPAGFSLLEAAELKSVLEDGGVIRCKQQALTCEEITAHIDAQKLVTNLALDWQDRITFILHQDGSIKRLKFADELREQNDDIDREDVAARIDADYSLMTAELGAMVKQLTDALGGVAEVSA